MDWMLLGLAFLFGFLGSVAGWFLTNGFFWVELQQVKRQAASAWGTNHSREGVQAREEIEAEIKLAMGEAAAIIEGQGEAKDKAGQMLKLAAKYPRAAARLIRELKKAGVADAVGLGQWM